MSNSCNASVVWAMMCRSAMLVCQAPKCEEAETTTAESAASSRASWNMAEVLPPEPVKAIVGIRLTRKAFRKVNDMRRLYIFNRARL